MGGIEVKPRIQTIHANACGDVLNDTTATGFRIGDLEVRLQPDGMVTIKQGSLTVNAEFLQELVAMCRPARPHRWRCYTCDREVSWLAPDGRCGDCTHMTRGEVTGDTD